MTGEGLFWIYLLNAVVLIDHEIDSAYWQEWKLFGSEDALGGIQGFLVMHIPLLAMVIYGLVLVQSGSFWGLVISGALAAGGIFAFVFHTYHLRKGRTEFKNATSKAILWSCLLLSLVQAAMTGTALIRGQH